MNATTVPPNHQNAKVGDRDVLLEARTQVREMLTRSQAFLALPLEQQREIARNTVEIVRYLAAPEGIPGHQLTALAAKSRPGQEGSSASATARSTATAAPLAGNTGETGGPGGDQEGTFVAQGAREGAAVAGALLQAVNFPEFVGGLINGVFHSIVDSSIKQMEAYGKLVADVAKSLNQFRDENVSANQGRDHLVDQFPDTFMIDVDTGDEEGAAPRVRLRDGVDEGSALRKVNSLPIEGGPLKSLDLDDDAIEERVVQAARTQLATSRQQLLATMVLMGINRIIVTDGRISAKVMYDFTARDNFKFKGSATRFDYADQMKTSEFRRDATKDLGSERVESGLDVTTRDAGFYSKGLYQKTSEPVLKLVSASTQTTDASLSTKAQLAGSVEVNFKSETFPLEKMADSFQIGMIQNASKPAPRAEPSARAPAATPGGGTSSPPASPPPAGATS